MSTKPICIETVNLFLSSCCVKALSSAVWSLSLNVRDDHIFKTSRFVLMGLESLQIHIKLISFVESCRLRLTQWVRVNLAEIYSNNQFANIFGLADVSLIDNSFTFKHYWQSPNHNILKFESKFLSLSVIGWNFVLVESCRQMLAWLGKVHPNLSICCAISRPFSASRPILRQRPCYCTSGKCFFLALHFFLLPHFSQVGIVVRSSRWYLRQSLFDQRRLCRHATTDQFFVV